MTAWTRSRRSSLARIRATCVLAVPLGDVERLGDLGVGEAAGELLEHLALAGGQLCERSCGRRGGGCSPEVVVDQAAGDVGGEQRFAGGDDADAFDEPLGRVGLEQEPRGARSECFIDVFVEAVGGEDEDSGVGSPCGELPGRLDAVEDGHADVHQHDVGIERSGERDGLRAVGCLADHLDVALRLEDQPQAAADDRLVVDEEDADHDGSGRLARSAHPPCGCGPASKWPPKTATRSPMPERPRRLPWPFAAPAPSSLTSSSSSRSW